MTLERLLAGLDTLEASGRDLYTILDYAVRGLHDLDPRYHWTGVYELFPDQVLRLGPYVGAPTEHVFIGVGNGICGTAVAERRNMNVPDVRTVVNYLACSSDTRSELVILIRTGDVIHGQLDIDSHEVAAFDAASVAQVQAVADRLAVAYAAAARGRHAA